MKNQIDIYAALDLFERACRGDQAATLECGAWLLGAPLTLNVGSLALDCLELLTHAQSRNVPKLDVLRALSVVADCQAITAAVVADRPAAVPAPLVVARPPRTAPHKHPRTAEPGAGAWPRVVPVPAGAFPDDAAILEAPGPHGEIMTWQDAAGTYYDHTVHAWSRTHLAPAVTAGGRFRGKQGSLKAPQAAAVAPGASVAVPGDSTVAGTGADRAPQAPTSGRRLADDAKSWTAAEADLSNACAELESADDKAELDNLLDAATLKWAGDPGALRELELAHDQRSGEICVPPDAV